MQKLKRSWSLGETVLTSAGSVAAGSTGDGPDLVLAHGWPWSSFSWHRVIPALAETYRVHWYDMPGYGQSDKRPEQATALDVQGSVFSEMLAHWKLDRPRVVAHDFGGAATLRAHLLHGCEFGKFALMNVVAMRPWGSDFFDHVGRHVEAFTGLPLHIHKAVVEAYIRGALVNEIDSEDFSKLVEPWLDEDDRRSFYRQFSQADECFTADVEPMFGQIRCPVTILWGADDPWIPLERGKALHERIPQSSFQSFPGVGHMPQLEAPRQIFEALAEFLRDDIAT
ncbi:alpha/beta hydrolase [uncultured Roseobacter sp.]|uniref:alpha/beta fold hydrolase n=1 Tax=uncultured Roseobacter sp. TaxID=114847 RepID=UPI0026071CC3|nr:alpha/beta hydrolase [uncultured Roseobacter sp.]